MYTAVTSGLGTKYHANSLDALFLQICEQPHHSGETEFQQAKRMSRNGALLIALTKAADKAKSMIRTSACRTSQPVRVNKDFSLVVAR